MPPREVPPQSARKRKGEPCCLATSTRGHASKTQTPNPALINGQGCIEREKSPPIENGQCQTIEKTKVTSERTQDAGLTRTSNLGRCPNNRGTLHSTIWLARAQSNTRHLIAPSPRHHASCRWRRPNCPSTAALGH